MRTVRHKSGAIEYVPEEREIRAEMAKAAEVAELARALRTLAACVSPMMVEAAAQPSVGGGSLMPERFLIERRMERLEKALGRITLAGDTGSAAKGRAAR